MAQISSQFVVSSFFASSEFLFLPRPVASLSFFFLLHRRHPLLLPTLSPRAIAGILDTATTPALSPLSSLAINPVVFSLNATASPLSLSPLFLLHQPTSSRRHGPSFPYLFTHDPRGSLFADDNGCRFSSFFLLIVSLCFLTTSTAPAFLSSLSTTGPRRRPWLFTVVAPPSASSSLFADDHTTAPFSAFFCVFSTSVAVVAADRRLPFPLLHRRCLLLRLPNAAGPPCPFSPPPAFFLFLSTTADFAVYRCYRRSCCRPPTPLFSLFFSVFCCRRYRRLPPLLPTPKLSLTPPPSLFFLISYSLLSFLCWHWPDQRCVGKHIMEKPRSSLSIPFFQIIRG